MKNIFNAVAKVFKTDPNKVDPQGRSRLHRAILANDVKKVKSLLKAGADINFRADLIYPPLHFALVYDRHEIASVLIDAGADINLANSEGTYPLHLAAKNSQEYIMENMLKLGANPRVRDNSNRTPLHVLSTAQPEMMVDLVRYGADINAQDRHGDTPLHRYVSDIHMLKMFFRLNANPNIANDKGLTAFQKILESDMLLEDTDIVTTFVKNGANVNATNKNGLPLLYLALKNREFDLYDICFDDTDLTIKDDMGRNAAHWMVIREELNLLSATIEKEPKLIKDKDGKGRTPLAQLIIQMHKASTISLKMEQMATLLLSQKDNSNTVDHKGRGLLHYAVEHSRADLIEFLHGKGVTLDVRDANGVSPLHVALNNKNMSMLDLLLDLGANPDLTDDRGWTVLDRLAEKGDRDSPFVQRLIVAGGQYVKQLPLSKEHMRNSNINTKARDDLPKKKGSGGLGKNIRKSPRGPSA